jgi:hypothetical protein
VGVSRDKSFEEDLKAFQADLPRLDEALRYVEYELAENPGAGIQSDVPGIYVAPTRLPNAGALARVSIFYTYDGKDVTFRRIRLAR